MYARSNASSNASERPQVRSALGSLKRTWSGNQQDLGSSANSTAGKSTLGPPSSQEVFYEWSDSPSPPLKTKELRLPATDSDKENGESAPPEKKAKAAPLSLETARTAPQQTGFVSASSLQRSSNHGNRNAAAVSSSGYSRPSTGSSSRPHAQSYAQPYARPSVHPSLSSDLAKQFSYDRGQARNGPSMSASGPSSASVPSSAAASSSANARTSSAPALSWMKTASQLKSEKRNDPTAYQASSLISSSGQANAGRGSPSLDNKKNVNKIFLSQEQRKVLQMVVEEGKNVFFTGSAGTGKSVLLREIIRELRRKHAKRPESVAVTASTGIAACNIGGVTIHSFAGIGLGKEPVTQLMSKIRKQRKSTARWQRTQVLIVDEVSMVDPALLDKLEEIARLIRKKPDKPFGGIQLVITGDFFQLPPVNPGSSVTFAFDARCWNQVVQHKVNLTQVFRQKDESFVTMLNEMRFGRLSQKTIDAFRKLERVPTYADDIVPTELFPMRNEVDRANMERLNALQTESQSYRAQDGGTLQGEARERVLANSIALSVLHLKKGAQVMLIKNLDETLVNGSVGKVIDFMDDAEYDKQTGALDMSEFQQKEDRDQTPRTSTRKWPLVRFHLSNGQTRDYLARPESWKTELPDGEVQASRTQVPLILAWAMSIHKSQGQTLPCCKINLGRVFEKGQAYVALSRATSLEGLQVLGFRPDKVMAHPRVIQWSQSLIALSD